MEQIAEIPYLQYFIRLLGYQEEAPFDVSTLVLFRRRISAEMLMEVNEYILSHKDDDNNTLSSSGNLGANGTLISSKLRYTETDVCICLS